MSEEIRSGLLQQVSDVESTIMSMSGDVKDSGATDADRKRGDSDSSDGDADGSDADGSDADGSDSDTDGSDTDTDGSDAADADGTDH